MKIKMASTRGAARAERHISIRAERKAAEKRGARRAQRRALKTGRDACRRRDDRDVV